MAGYAPELGGRICTGIVNSILKSFGVKDPKDFKKEKELEKEIEQDIE